VSIGQTLDKNNTSSPGMGRHNYTCISNKSCRWRNTDY